MDFFKDHNHKRLFQLLLLSVLALFLSLLSNQIIMATAEEAYCIGTDCIHTWWGEGTVGYLTRWTGVRILGDSAIYQSVDSIGIGTTTPAQKLHVAGYARADSGFCIGTSCITAWPQGEVTGSGTANYIPRWTTSSNIGNSAIYQSGSNVGIGTTSPGGKLEILQNMSDYGAAFTAPHLNLGAANTLDSVGFVGVTYDASTSNNYGWSVGALRSNNGQSSFVWKYHNNSAAGVERARIDELGNVGVGTASPAQKLHVAGYARADSGFCIGTSCITAWPQGEVTGTGTTNYVPLWTTSSNIGNSIIYQSGTNIGIGTTSPGAKLEVAGDIRLNAANNGILTNHALILSADDDGSSATEHMIFKTKALERAIITSGGDVGIGTSSPAQKLHVAGYARADSGFCIGTSCITAWPQGEVTGSGTANYVPLWTTSSNVGNSVIYQSGSNVGIGTTSPAQKLHVAGGNINIDENYAYLYNGVQAVKLTKGTDAYYYTNTFVGASAGNASATEQTALGYYAGYNNTGDYQTALGNNAGYNNTGDYQTALGQWAGYYNTGDYQTALGYDAGDSNTGPYQTALGSLAGYGNEGDYQTALGYYAGFSNIGDYQIALGYKAGYYNTGVAQTALGQYAGYNNKGANQIALGYKAGYDNTGIGQTALGYYAGRSNTGDFQTALGYAAGRSNTGIGQTALGYQTGYSNTGAYQTALGYDAGNANAGDRVIGIGYEATKDASALADDVVAIGYQAGKGNTVPNQFIVHQANINTVPLIQGDFASGNVGIGTTSPQAKLDVNGSVRADEYLYSSDASLKTGIGHLPGDDMLAKVLKLQGVSFNWKESGQPSIGFIAQDVEKIFPELVKTDQDGIKSIQYGNLIAPLVESIKEQQKQIEQLRQEIEELKR